MDLGPTKPTKEEFWDRMEVIRKVSTQPVTFGFAPDVPYVGPQWLQSEFPFNDSYPVPAAKLSEIDENMPGAHTDGFDAVNVHLHGAEVCA